MSLAASTFPILAHLHLLLRYRLVRLNTATEAFSAGLRAEHQDYWERLYFEMARDTPRNGE